VRGETLKTTWIVVLSLLCAAIAALEALGISVTLGSRAMTLASSVAIVLFLSFVHTPSFAWTQKVLDLCNGMLLFGTISLIGALVSYAVLRVTPFADADPLLYRADLAFGLDWRAIYDEYLQYPTLGAILGKLYMAIFWIPLLVVASLAVTGQERVLHRFLVTFALALAITLVVFVFFPAVTPLIYLIGENPPYISAGGTGYPVIAALRAGTLHEIDLQTLQGLITFPSFHAAGAVMFAWATWSVRAYRWPMVLINAGMMVATPIAGAHYFIDLVGGVAIAGLAITLVALRDRKSGGANRQPAFHRPALHDRGGSLTPEAQ
jgi:membrane-associated phospholipid phosphatase